MSGAQVATLKTQRTEIQIANQDLERAREIVTEIFETDNQQSARELEKMKRQT